MRHDPFGATLRSNQPRFRKSTRPFDGFDKLPFDKLRVFDTASKLRAPSRFDKLKAPSESRGKVEGLTLAATRSRRLNCGI